MPMRTQSRSPNGFSCYNIPKDGMTALMIATDLDSDDVAELLEAVGAQ